MIKINKISLIVASIIIAIVIVLMTIFIGKKNNPISPIINGIPENTAFFFETDNFVNTIKTISDNIFYKELAKNKIIEKKISQFNYIDSLISTNPEIKKLLSTNKVLISAHNIGNQNFDYLYLMILKKNQQQQINMLISKLFKNTTKKNKSNYDNEIIYKINFNQSSENDFYYSFTEDFFLFSFSKILIQKSIRKIHSDISSTENDDFIDIYNSSEVSKLGKIYINYRNFTTQFSSFFNKSFAEEIMLISSFADRSVFTFNLEEKKLQMSGYTLTSNNNYLDLFKSKSPDNFGIFKILPDKVSSFVFAGINNGEDFKIKYIDYLSEIKLFNKYRRNLISFHKKYKINEDKNNLYKITENEMGFAIQDINKNGFNHNKYIFIKTNNKQAASEFFNQIIETHISKEKSNKKDFYLQYQKNETNFTIRKLPESNIPKMYYGSIYNNIKADYMCFIEDYIVFAESESAIYDIINSYAAESSYKNKSPDAGFINSFSGEANIFFYTNIFNSNKIINNILSDKTKKIFTENIQIFNKFKGPGIQFIADSYPVYTLCQLEYEDNPSKISETVWECKLDTTAETKPFLVLNHNNNEKEIFIQDYKNKIYLINKKGQILWERQLSDKILSDVFQIDYFKNNKLQLLFNSKNNIYIIDRNGNYIENYPIKLKSQATNGINVVDYDNNKEYRLFYADTNKKINLLDKTGKKIEGWQFEKTKSIVKNKIQYFRYKNKDYIVFSDNTKVYILNRKGDVRVKPLTDFSIGKNSNIYFEEDTPKSKARFVATNNNGTIYFVYLDGNVKKMIIDNFTINHYFSYIDVTGNGIKEFIFADRNQTKVYGRKKNRIFTYSINDKINIKPSFYRFSEKNIKIGIVSKKENKIYLVDKSGFLHKNFPLRGNNNFSVGKMSIDESFSIIVGSNDSYLYKYLLNY